MHIQTDAHSKKQATVSSILGCHGILRTKGGGSLLFFLTVLLDLAHKKRKALFLSLTRTRTEVIYIASGRRRGRGRRKGNGNLKSEVSWWKKGFRQCHSNKKLSCFGSYLPLPQSYIPGWDVMDCSPHAVGTSPHSYICPKKLWSGLEVPMKIIIPCR